MYLRIGLLCHLIGFTCTAAGAEEAGETYFLKLSHEEESRDSKGSGGSTRGRDDLVEKIIEITDDGRIVEYDLPLEPGEERKPLNWQFPARFLIDAKGEARLLNADDLAERNAAWRELAGIEESACGSYYFTWNAFKIECDPQSVLAIVDRYNLRFGPLEEGLELPYPDTLGAATLRDCTEDSGQITFCATYNLDPEAVRQSRIETDKIVAQIVGEEAARRTAKDRTKEQIEGTLQIRLSIDGDGHVWKRVVTTDVKTMKEDGEVGTSTSREELTRTLIEAD
ncbi:hypothetical protein [Parerythrobacter aestuarii]|uniref:hypothetical protein n=1 Tax=Parerythrobacter aestuarii TaxID=3020909 RepID=UPI0024DEF479|nr:hypothetical protein [Parerythrobacter aestuarii]